MIRCKREKLILTGDDIWEMKIDIIVLTISSIPDMYKIVDERIKNDQNLTKTWIFFCLHAYSFVVL